jgi:chromosome segregation ATPase
LLTPQYICKESARLRRQMEFLVEELDGHKEESEKIRLQSEKDVQSLKHRLGDTIQSLKSLEEDYDALKNKYKQEQVAVGSRQEQRWIDRCKGYEEEVAKLRDAFIISEKRATEAEQKLLQYEQSATLIHQGEDEEREEDNDDNIIAPAQTTSEGKATVASMISVRQQTNRDPVTADDYLDHYLSPSSRKRRKVFGDVPSSVCSPAPPAVMRELTKVRLSLADAERTNRMLTRKYEEAKSKLQELRKVNEQYERSQERVAILESQYSSVLKKLMTMEEVEKEWKHFRKELCFTSLSEQKTILMDTKNDIASSAPPEISAVIRKIQTIQIEVKEKTEECEKYRLQLETSNQRIQTLQGKIDAQVHSLSQMKQQHDNEKKRITLLQMEVDRAQASERIAKMEAKSMQQLLNTYELLEASEVKDGTMKIPGVGSGDRNAAGPIISGLRTSLSSAQEEINVLKETHATVCKQLETLQGRLDEKITEHERVLDKFNKLKASLMEEREKARVAEDRALHAESLAGKGHFDPDKTRALHLKENPFMKAVRAKYESQISALEAVIERHKKESEYSPKPVGSTSASSTPAASSVGLEGLEAKKLNQRLKDSFQEHIGVFREAVYLLTGYKVDMIMDSDSPRFRVRSMYAEVCMGG